MTTIMVTGGAIGDGRCDARCHKAYHRKCSCVCGGRYHGVGTSKRAEELLTEDLIEGGRLSEKQILAVRQAQALAEDAGRPGPGQEPIVL